MQNTNIPRIPAMVNSPMLLSREEVICLTGKRLRPAQARALRTMGIEHKVRPDGEVLVLRSHLEKLLDGSAGSSGKRIEVEPNWSAMNGKV